MQWITTWAQAHADMGMLCGNYKDHTVKTTVVSCLSGDQLRLRMENYEGKKPVHILQIGIQIENGPIVPVTVHGKNEVVLQPKQAVYSDPVTLCVADGQDITISMAFSGKATSGNQLPETVRYGKADGNAAGAEPAG